MNGWLAAAVTVALLVPTTPRWLRLAQREHYLPWSVSRFAERWWTCTALNAAVFTVTLVTALVALGALVFDRAVAGWMSLAVALVATAFPLGLSWRGRTSKLVWTRRMKTTTAVVAVLDLVLVALARHGAPVLVLLQPFVVDVALAVTAPFERRAMQTYVRSATAKLRSVAPVTVAITGSYGKTSTKQYVRHLVSATRSVLASPASFNNTGGLSRTLNEHLAPGTEVFVAEMGMYGPGEIRAMCRWVQPHVGVITAIGPVHLERVGSLDGIVAAKSEIVEDVAVAVLNVDALGMAELAARCEADGKRVWRCSASDTSADVAVVRDGGSVTVWVRGEPVGTSTTGAQEGNLACAVAVALALDVPVERIAERLGSLPEPEHRQQVVVAPSGVTVIDNTFSSNPASAASSVALLARLAQPGRRAVVVTPGMVELGALAPQENAAFARAAAAVATDLVVVGLTNRRALLAGAARGRARVHTVRHRDDAVAWVRAELGPGDVVLYENDLPDHYP